MRSSGEAGMGKGSGGIAGLVAGSGAGGNGARRASKRLGQARFLQNAVRGVPGFDVDRDDNPLAVRVVQTS
jgi:hypothetical protein